MKLERRKPSGREKDGAAVKLLAKLREQLYSSHALTRRRAASRLSWMQEDGLDIFKEALFGDTTRSAKSAAAYGLRRMQGRMKKAAIDTLEEGLKHKDSEIRVVCENALLVLSTKSPGKFPIAEKVRGRASRIREIPRRGQKKSRIQGRRPEGRRRQPR